jgi:hypothetical protein
VVVFRAFHRVLVLVLVLGLGLDLAMGLGLGLGVAAVSKPDQSGFGPCGWM